MREKMSASETLAKRGMKSNFQRRLPLFIGLGLLLIAIVIAAIIIGRQIMEENRINKAHSVIMQLDVNTTYKKPEFAENDDWDNDGIMNGKEEREGTNLQNEDTDSDGLSDGDELKIGTEPNNPDTDGDELLDGYELMVGLDPTKTCTDGETNDAQRVVSITKQEGQVEVELTGDANICNTTVEELDIFGITSNTSVVSKVYDFYSDYEFATATITFELDSDKISKMGYSYDRLSILKFDASTLKYTKIDSKLSSDKKTISADITELDTYVVGIEKTVNNEATTRIAFLVDNSGSMYPKELCPPSSENDVNFKRLDFASSLINKIEGEYTFSIAKFTGEYTKLQGFTADRKKLTSALNGIRNGDEVFTGTSSQTSLELCMNEFDANADGKYRNIVVMLTDGQSDEDNPKSVEQLIAIAKDKNVVILTVGLGTEIDRNWLQEIAYETGGKYYSASDANALDDVYKQIVTTLNYDIVSYSESADSVNGYSLYNTGFSPEVNGFSFKNFRTTTSASVDFGMAILARDWYLGNVATSLDELSPRDESQLKYTAAGYNFADTDIAKDYEEKVALYNISPSIMKSRFTDIKQYLNYNSKGGTLKVYDEFTAEAKNSGWESEKYSIDSENLEWDYVELLSLDLAKGITKIGEIYSPWEAQFMAALYRLNAIQWDDSESEFNLTNGDDGFNRLQNLLGLGVPVVTTIDDSHSVNAIGLIQDSICHREYVLQIYDNNYPGKIREIYITKSPIGKFDIKDGKATLVSTSCEYLATYDGTLVGLSFSDVDTH